MRNAIGGISAVLQQLSWHFPFISVRFYRTKTDKSSARVKIAARDSDARTM